MEEDNSHIIFSYVSPLSSIEMPENIPLSYMKRYINKIYEEIARQNREETILDSFFYEYLSVFNIN